MALVAPASPAGEERIALALDNLRALELEPVLGAHARATGEYLAGNDDERAADLNDALRDPSIRGIIALRGGYGTMRILDNIDYAALTSDPKCVMGYSDMTALLNTFAQRSRVVTFHGPVAGVPMSASQYQRLKNALFYGEFETLSGEAVVPGSARGTLRGGNLSLIAALCGTPYAIDFEDAVVLLEDVDEDPYRIDRLFTQLDLARAFEHAAAFAIGDIPAPHVVRERIAGYGRPTVAGTFAGHLAEQAALPIGAPVELEALTR